jgi:hypothetical protein
MSFFGKLFTRNITFIEHVERDQNYPDLLHVFGAVRIMPDDGDSFDIYRHSIIDLNTYEVINGLQQRGNSFSIKSAYAKRAMEEMSARLNKKLSLLAQQEKRTEQYEEDEDFDEEIEEMAERDDLEDNCEFPVAEGRSDDSDTDEPKKLPRTCLYFEQNKSGHHNFFTVQLIKGNVAMQAHSLRGMHDYFRHVLHLKNTGRLLCTYRKENLLGTGGMGFYVIDVNSGALLHDAMLK